MMRCVLWACVLVGCATAARAQTLAATDAEIAALRDRAVEAFNRGEMDSLASMMDRDVIITWPDAHVSRGVEAMGDHYRALLSGDRKMAESIRLAPRIEGSRIAGDAAVVYGTLDDTFVMSDGTEVKLNSHFTATLLREKGEWKIAQLHTSGNLFDNPLLKGAIGQIGWSSGVAGGSVGLLIGLFMGWTLGIRRAYRMMNPHNPPHP